MGSLRTSHDKTIKSFMGILKCFFKEIIGLGILEEHNRLIHYSKGFIWSCPLGINALELSVIPATLFKPMLRGEAGVLVNQIISSNT